MSPPLVVLIAYPDFSPIHFAIPQAVFGSRFLPEQRLFTLQTASVDGTPVPSDTGGMFLHPDGDVTLLDRADILVVPGWLHTDCAPDPRLLAALQRAHRRGACIAGLCLGTYVLAYAGLLEGCRAATHWECEADFCARFPNVRLDANALYQHDGTLITSAGVAASMDCCLHIVREWHGTATANRLARRLVASPHREGGQAQFIDQPLPCTTQDARINRLLDHLQAHLHEPHTLDSLARHAAMSRRSFTRHFRRATGLSPGDWLLHARLQRSCELLETTTLPIERIAELAGFRHAASLRTHFHRRYRLTPQTWRKKFGTTVE